MNTLARNTSSTFSHRISGYEPLDQGGAATGERGRSWRALSKRKEAHHVIRTRGERSRQRQIFLKSYTLVSMDESRTEKLKKVVVKIKTAAVSVMASSMRIGSLRSSCRAPAALWVSSPGPKARKFGS